MVYGENVFECRYPELKDRGEADKVTWSLRATSVLISSLDSSRGENILSNLVATSQRHILNDK